MQEMDDAAREAACDWSTRCATARFEASRRRLAKFSQPAGLQMANARGTYLDVPAFHVNSPSLYSAVTRNGIAWPSTASTRSYAGDYRPLIQAPAFGLVVEVEVPDGRSGGDGAWLEKLPVRRSPVRVYVGVTDAHWARHLAFSRAEEVNFWRPAGDRVFRALTVGE